MPTVALPAGTKPPVESRWRLGRQPKYAQGTWEGAVVKIKAYDAALKRIVHVEREDTLETHGVFFDEANTFLPLESSLESEPMAHAMRMNCRRDAFKPGMRVVFTEEFARYPLGTQATVKSVGDYTGGVLCCEVVLTGPHPQGPDREVRLGCVSLKPLHEHDKPAIEGEGVLAVDLFTPGTLVWHKVTGDGPFVWTGRPGKKMPNTHVTVATGELHDNSQESVIYYYPHSMTDKNPKAADESRIAERAEFERALAIEHKREEDAYIAREAQARREHDLVLEREWRAGTLEVEQAQQETLRERRRLVLSYAAAIVATCLSSSVLVLAWSLF